MDHEQFVKEYRGGHDLSAGEVLVALGIGFGLFHLMRFLDPGSIVVPNPLPPPVSTRAPLGS
jgi:hypothetical protein